MEWMLPRRLEMPRSGAVMRQEVLARSASASS
jgi:hypothetical protein